MNCWPSGKYVCLLYMYSILGWGSFCFNVCLTSAWHGGDQFVALLRWYEAQVSLTVAFSSSACFGLLFLIFLLTIHHRFSLGFRSGEFAGQSSTPTPWSFNQLLVLLAVWAGAQILLENEISIFKKLVNRRKHELLQNVLVNGCSDVGFAWFCLTILIRLRFSRLAVYLFLPHFFLPLNFLLTCLDTAPLQVFWVD